MNSRHEENPHIGSHFDDFLTEAAILDEATAVATQRVIAWQISEGMSQVIGSGEFANRANRERCASRSEVHPML